MTKPRILSREPWPALGIDNYRTIEDGPWGYLLVYADGSVEFDRAIPSREEILQRWAMYIELKEC